MEKTLSNGDMKSNWRNKKQSDRKRFDKVYHPGVTGSVPSSPNKKLILKSCPLVKKENGVICEVAAVLLADASNDDFIIELAKYLTTLNSFPERF